MFCMAAQSLGYRVCVLDPGSDSPAGAIADRHVQADYLDEAGLAQVARLCRSTAASARMPPPSPSRRTGSPRNASSLAAASASPRTPSWPLKVT
jgi:hypothetical protein